MQAKPMLSAAFALLLVLAPLRPARAGEDALPKATTVAGGVPMASVWFQDIQTPLGLSNADGTALCQALYEGLKRGVCPDVAIGSCAGADSPRAIFLSWSDGTTAARTSVGMASSAVAALQAAFRKATESTPSPRQMKWFKLDIVQRGEGVNGFGPRDSRLPLPSLFGLSFGPAAGFDFLPEQLVSWDMVNPQRQLCVLYVTERVIGQEYGRYLSDAERLRQLGRWTALTTYSAGQKVCLFETQSFFHDGTQCVPLFRGHPLYSNVSVAELRQAATAAGDRLAEYCSATGRFECSLLEWELGKPEGAMPRDYALAILALVRLHQDTGVARYLKAAERAGGYLAGAVRSYGGNPKAGCLPEAQRVNEVAGVAAEAQVTVTATNALAVAALCELSEAAKTESYNGALAMLAQHLVLQVQPDGSVMSAREFPSQALRPTVGTEGADATLLAFSELYGTVARETFLVHAKTVAAALRKSALAAAQMEDLPRDVWLIEALDRLFTFTRDESLVEPVGRLALAALLDQAREVDFPDGYGAVGNQPSALLAADRSRLIAIAARLLRDLGQTEGIETLLGEVRPFVLFQLQTRITPATALYLPDPRVYLGLFRDHVMDYGFELRGQAIEILSLLAMAREMDRLGRSDFPEDLIVQRGLAEAQAQCVRWPRYLTPALAATATQSGQGQVVEFHDLGTETVTIRPPDGKTKRSKKELPFVPVRRVQH